MSFVAFVYLLCFCLIYKDKKVHVHLFVLYHIVTCTYVLPSLAIWLNVCLQTKSLWVQIPLMSTYASTKDFLDIQTNYRVKIHSETQM